MKRHSTAANNLLGVILGLAIIIVPATGANAFGRLAHTGIDHTEKTEMQISLYNCVKSGILSGGSGEVLRACLYVLAMCFVPPRGWPYPTETDCYSMPSEITVSSGEVNAELAWAASMVPGAEALRYTGGTITLQTHGPWTREEILYTQNLFFQNNPHCGPPNFNIQLCMGDNGGPIDDPIDPVEPPCNDDLNCQLQ